MATTLTFPNESAEYRAARNALLDKELEQRRAIEAVAAQRRSLPPGGEIPEDYAFTRLGADGAPEPVQMSELFSPGSLTLAIYSFMYGPDRDRPCEGCTGLLDALDRPSTMVNQKIDFVVAARSPIARIESFATERDWRNLRLVSTADTTYNRDYFGTAPEGYDLPMFNVFQRDGDVIRHFWGAEMMYADPEPGQDMRSNDSIDAFWMMLDLTPEGRGTDDTTTLPPVAAPRRAPVSV